MIVTHDYGVLCKCEDLIIWGMI